MMTQRLYLRLVLRHLTLMSKGIRYSRISPTKMLSIASALTGQRYKRGDFNSAISDINKILENKP